ncbi:MAG: hypothetical protein H5T49_00360 [Hadesarchaea archaeon]|nr:hypothetical protein [Hadesarchaea archaeon]
MLITTSRRPCHLARILCRELALVLPGGEYLPRGVKTIEKTTLLAKQRGHGRVMFVSSFSGRPGEIRFIEVGETWRWLDASIRLAGVTINRRKSRIGDSSGMKIYAADPSSYEFARWLGRILEIECVERPPESGPVILITSDGGLEIKFRVMPSTEDLGPVLTVASYGPLFKKLR